MFAQKGASLFLTAVLVLLPIAPVISFPLVAEAIAPTTIFEDGFESENLSLWTSSGDDWSVTSGSGHSGSKKAQVTDQ